MGLVGYTMLHSISSFGPEINFTLFWPLRDYTIPRTDGILYYCYHSADPSASSNPVHTIKPERVRQSYPVGGGGGGGEEREERERDET